MHEFNLIDEYFTWDKPPTNAVVNKDNVLVSVGDDAAVVNIPSNKQLVISVDTLISGVHFPEKTSAEAIAHKALAVNLSDLAAMGATPEWFTLALTLPSIDHQWLAQFSAALKTLAFEQEIRLIGGDTTRGSLSITIQVMGFVELGKALLRNTANSGDKIYVTGTLGDAAAGLQCIRGKLELPKDGQIFCEQRLNYPQARLFESGLLRKFASSCIDVSDGLLQDLSHILHASEVGAVVDLSSLPYSNALKKMDAKKARQFALSGGDDYELLFTVPVKNEAAFLRVLNDNHVSASCIGIITQEKGLFDNKKNELTATGYNHFNE